MFLTFFQFIGIMSFLTTSMACYLSFVSFLFSVVAVINAMPSLNMPTIFMRFLGSCLWLSKLLIVLGYWFTFWMNLFSVLSMSLPYWCSSAPRKKKVARYSSFAVACILVFCSSVPFSYTTPMSFLLTWSYLYLDQFHHQNTKWNLPNSWRT